MINQPLIDLYCKCGQFIRKTLPNGEHLCKCGLWCIFRNGQLIEAKKLPFKNEKGF